METRNQKCPTCSRTLTQHDDVFTCAEHGDWVLYGTRLLVRPPTAEALRRETVTMPWEQRLPLAA
ncbi:MAG: hypothetical protein H0X37_05740 [Herpetosiphonaceae bacterium]|nr:hypothetical protein [Herpetosiphonaceae bacterium]